MWKTLNFGHNVCIGDKIRYANKALPYHTDVYKVEQTEQYYFVIAPEEPGSVPSRQPNKKVVRHFDIQHYIDLELWIDGPNATSQA